MKVVFHSSRGVLGILPTYFMSIYLMPTTIRNKLESMRNKFFIGCDQDDKKMTWVKWKRCLASKTQGGLDIGNIYGLNMGLLFKWIWRFFIRPIDLRARVIQNIYMVIVAVFLNLLRTGPDLVRGGQSFHRFRSLNRRG